MPRCSVLRSFARLIPGCIYDKVTFDPKIGGEFIFEDGSINFWISMYFTSFKHWLIMMFIFLRTGLTYVEKETRKGGKALYSSHGFAYNYVKKLENGSLQYKCQLQHRDKSAGCSGTLTVTCDGEVTDRVQHSEQWSEIIFKVWLIIVKMHLHF